MRSQISASVDGGHRTHLLRELDRICDRFEAAWCAGLNPRIEEYLADVAEPTRPQLLQELIALEVAYRRKDGETPAWADYESRFPSDKATVRAGFAWGSSIEVTSARPRTDGPSQQRSAEATMGSDDSSNRASAGRFEVIRHYARGGLGDVFVARDSELDREVALKEIQEHHAEDPQIQERFTREAEITGRLEHPGIVPVYGYGRHHDGRPYYAMRMVQGETLKDAIGALHSRRSEDRDPSARVPELRRLLDRFLDVCQAIHYAHSRGVIHRDIKPANILLGAYGETLVVDWGLAKAVGRPRDVPPDAELQETTLRPRPAPENQATLQGCALGTPEFMSPEQASGRVDQIGPASDVFNLGATLFCILTGRSPLTGSGADRIIDRARRANVQRAREVNPHVPRPLEAICAKALARDIDDRYQSARDMAEDIEHYLADEPVSSYRERWLERSSRWGRSHRVLVRAAAIGLVTLAGAATVSLVLIEDARQRAVASADKEHVARTEAEQAQQQEAEMRRHAEQVEDFLVSAFRSPDPDLGGREIKVADILDRERQRLLTELDEDPVVKARLLMAIGNSYHGLGLLAEAIEVLEQSREIYDEQLGREHPDTLTSMGSLARVLRAAGKLDTALPLLQETLKLRVAILGPHDPGTLSSMNDLALALHDVERLEQAIRLHEETLRLRKATLGPDHPSTLISMNNLAFALLYAGQLEQALPLYAETLKLTKATLGPHHPQTLNTMNNYARALHNADRLDEALPLYRETLQLRRATLGHDHPQTLLSMNNLALGLNALGKHDEELPLLEKTMNLMKTKLGPDHPNTLKSMNNLAAALYAMEKFDDARLLNEETLKLRRVKFGLRHRDTLSSMHNLAWSLLRLGKFDEAVPLFEETLTLLRETLGPEHPHTLQTMVNLADALWNAEQPHDALPLYEELLELRRARFGEDHLGTLKSMNRLAVVYRDVDRFDEALPLHDEVVNAARRTLGEDHADTRKFILNHALTLAAAGNLAESMALIEKSGLGAEFAWWGEQRANPTGSPPKPGDSGQ